jgi:hypothetical protein
MTAHGSTELAAEIRRRGLTAPARLLLEAHRPLRPLLDDLATFLSPILGPVLGQRSAQLSTALQDDAAIDQLLEELARGVDD